tara:strand:+ start:369 stop:809 length:441 start_codon:yes stop_codon:yes gene_type:complete
MDFKKSLLILCILIVSNTFSQNNLEFSQVINITKTEPVTTITINNNMPFIHYSPITDTIVPPGKVWEITTANSFTYITDRKPINTICPRFLLNDNLLEKASDLEGLWLKEGSKLSFYGYSCLNYSWSNHYISFNISIIEYSNSKLI